MTLLVSVFEQEGKFCCNITFVETGSDNDRTELHRRVVGQLEAAAYETIRRLVTNNEIPEAEVTWDNQRIRIH